MRFRVSMMLLLGLAVFSASAFGQAIGSITGVVQDASTARIPGVSVTATNTATGVKTPTVTNESGAYNFPNLAVGPYVLEATLPGFRQRARRQHRPARQRDVALQSDDGSRERRHATSRFRSTRGICSLSLRQASVKLLPQSQVTALPLVGGDVLDLISVLPGFPCGQFGAREPMWIPSRASASNSINTVRDGLSVT